MGSPIDFRVSATLFNHPKWTRLDAELGDKGGMALIRLWAWARLHREDDGCLDGLSDKEIANVAGWRGPPAKFIDVLLETGFLEGQVDERAVHDWHEHQPHSVNAKGVRRAQQLRAIKRWSKAAGLTPDEYCRFTYSMSLEEYVTAEKPPKKAPRPMPDAMPPAMPTASTTDASGNATGNAGPHAMAMPSPPLPSPPLTSTPCAAPAGGIPGAPPTAAPPPERGIARTPTSPPPSNPSGPHGPGRSRRQEPGVPDRPGPSPDDEDQTPDLDPSRTARIAGHLVMKIGCSPLSAAHELTLLLGAGWTHDDLQEAVKATDAKSALGMEPWAWRKRMQEARMDREAGHLG